MDETYQASAILLAHTLGTPSRLATPLEIEQAVTNAVQLRAEVNRQAGQRMEKVVLGLIEHQNRGAAKSPAKP
jgi:hypothetical protein